MDATKIYEGYQLHITAEKFYLEPCYRNGDRLSGEPCMQIDRITNEIRLSVATEGIPIQAERRFIYGIIGVIKLVAGPYLLVITNSELIGSLNGHDIFEVKAAEALPYGKTTLHLTEREIWYNRHFLEMVNNMINTPGYYYSHTFDLTHSLQRLDNTTPEFKKMPMHERADERFLWNRYVLTDLTIQTGLDRFALPLLHGYIGVRRVTVAGHTFQLMVISRRSWHRAGTRLFMRGANSEGHSANFVETEQIIEYNGSDSSTSKKYLCSFVQTRGSIPLFWSQKPNLKWLPEPKLHSEAQSQQAAFDRHMQDQLFYYNNADQVIVNLVSKKGRELKICRELERVATETTLKEIKYYAFDFHRELKNMNWDRLSVLISDLSQAIISFRFFGSRINGEFDPVIQTGYFRTNCIDCLDRTNVVQSLLAKESLKEQLRWLGILRSDDDLSHYPDFERAFKIVWADNGDACSSQYAGTGALKADFTRFGKRTYSGLLQDGRNAITRYVKNNFLDGYRQDAVDLFLGNYTVDRSNLPPALTTGMLNNWDWHTGIGLGAVLSFAMAVLCLLIASDHMIQFFLFWMFLFLVLSAVIVANGHEFVNCPKLKQD